MTLAELEAVFGKNLPGAVALLDKVTAAAMIAAEAVRTESDTTPNHANRLLWAKQAFENPVAMANRMWPAILASNASLTQTQVLNANDAGIQTAVNNAIDVFATAPVAV